MSNFVEESEQIQRELGRATAGLMMSEITIEEFKAVTRKCMCELCELGYENEAIDFTNDILSEVLGKHPRFGEIQSNMMDGIKEASCLKNKLN